MIKVITKRSNIKIIIDIAMSIVLFVLMSYQLMKQKNHEIAGAVMLILFLLHHIMNYKWYLTLSKGKYTPQRYFQVIVDIVLLIGMLGLMSSGIAMSHYIFRFLNFDMSISLARNLHMVLSYTIFLLTGVHIGLHYGMLRGKIRQKFHIKNTNKISTWIFVSVVGVINIYGAYALVKRNFLLYITLKLHFVYFDYKEPVIFYELDLFAIMILMLCLGFYLQRLLININRKKGD